MVAWSDSFARQIKKNHDFIMASSTGFWAVIVIDHKFQEVRHTYMDSDRLRFTQVRKTRKGILCQ